MLRDRIRQALAVLGSDHSVSGTVKQQATSYLGEECDEASLRYLSQTALVVYHETLDKAKAAKYDDRVAHNTALANVIIAGAAIGKRLGIEEGERFIKAIGDFDD